MKRAILFASYFLIIPSVISQNIDLTGTIADSLSKEPLIYAAVSIQSAKDKTFIKGEVSDDQGKFIIKGVKKEKIVIQIDYIGYKTKFIEVDLESRGNLDLGLISLSASNHVLNSVTVTGQRQNIVATIEKQIFRTDQLDVVKGGTAIEALRNIPSVSVNAEGEISVRGSKGFLILINGKPSQVDAATLLQQIPANTIDKIEMITAPGAKYDADGKAGIINIITKKGITDGYSLISNLNYGFPRIQKYENLTEPVRYGADLSYTLRKKDLDFTVSGYYLKNDIAGQRIGDVNTTIKNIFTSFPSSGERSLKRDNYGIRGLVSYKFNNKSDISAGYFKGERIQYRRADIFYNNIKTDLNTQKIIGQSEYFNPNLVKKQGSFDVMNLDYSCKVDKKSTFLVSGLYEKAVIKGFTKNANLRIPNLNDTIQYTLNNGNNPLDAYRLKLDYERELGNGKLSMGYQYRSQLQKGSFDYQEKQGSFLPLVRNDDFTADIRIKNIIHGIYTQYAGKFKRLDFSTGLRYENAYRNFSDDKANPPAILQLSNFFPSFNGIYTFNDQLKGKFGFSRRVQRSTNNELNPYPEREHSETLEQGDPKILPEFINITEAGIISDYKKVSLYANVYLQQINNIVNRVNSVYNDTILNRIYTNAGNALLLGSEMGATWSIHPDFKVFMGTNVYRLNIKGDLFDNSVAVNSNGWVYSLNSHISWNISEDLSSQFNLSYLSSRVTAQGEDSRYYLPNLSLKRSFANNKITATAQWQNISFGNMGVNEQRISTWGKDFYTTTNYIQETNIFLLNISYAFNQTGKKSKLPVSEFGEREY
jgi:ferric enterobactin receptor